MIPVHTFVTNSTVTPFQASEPAHPYGRKPRFPRRAGVERTVAEYRLYTLDHARRIVGCKEVVCADDRHAFIASTTLGDAGAEIEIWQHHRFVGLTARRPAPGHTLHRPLVTTVCHDHSDPDRGPPPRRPA